MAGHGRRVSRRTPLGGLLAAGAVKILRRVAIGLAILAIATGCASGVQPVVAPPMKNITLSTHIDSGGKIVPPEPDRTVTLPGKNSDLLVVLADIPGFAWQIGEAQDSTMLPAVSAEGPPICPTGISGCISSQGELYAAEASGTTTITFTLVAMDHTEKSPAVAPSASASPDAPTCPECGSIMIPNGSCHKCVNCGTTSGCS